MSGLVPDRLLLSYVGCVCQTFRGVIWDDEDIVEGEVRHTAAQRVEHATHHSHHPQTWRGSRGQSPLDSLSTHAY